MALTRTNEKLGIYHLAERPDLYEPMRNNNFELLVHDFDNLLKPGSTTTDDATDYYSAEEVKETIRFTVNKVNIPNYTISNFEVRRGNLGMKAAGTMSFGEGSLEVIDYIGADSKSILMAWQRLAGDPVSEKIGRMKDYKKQCQLLEYSPDFELVRYWEIYGAWISTVSNDEVTADGGNDKRVVTATLVFDKAIMHQGNDYSEN